MPKLEWIALQVNRLSRLPVKLLQMASLEHIQTDFRAEVDLVFQTRAKR